MAFLVRGGSIAPGEGASGSTGNGAASSTIRRRPRAVSGAARANRRQYSNTRPVILVAAAVTRPAAAQAEGSWSARTWRRITATTRSTTTASARGASAYAVTDRGLATSAADTFMNDDATAQARTRTRSARADFPARDRPSASKVNTIISASSSSASITLAASWRRTVKI
jgi:hypothetical protein